MRFVRRNDVPVGSATWWLARLLLLLALPWAAGAATAQPGLVDGRHGGPPPAYRVIQLAPGAIAAYPDINAGGQVAFTMVSGERTAAFFYDGASVRDIGSLGGLHVYANDLNDAGQIAGTSLGADGIEHAFVWSAAGGMLDLQAQPGAGRSYAQAINRRGMVTGAFNDAARPFRWSRAGGMEDLGIAIGLPEPASGVLLNDAGLIAGRVTLEDRYGDPYHRAFVWTRSNGMIDIDTLGSVASTPVAVGAGGEVAGNRLAAPDDGGDRPFLWTRATGMVDLGIGRGTTAWVNAMSPGLHIAGGIGYADGRQRAMSWTRQGGMRELGTLGGRTSVARAVNGRGQIVGFAEDGNGAMRAFVWSAGAGMRDLNRLLRDAPPGLVLDHALAINDSGAIVASANVGLVLLKPYQRSP
jgi:probable HAF family extracellular repeat protein